MSRALLLLALLGSCRRAHTVAPRDAAPSPPRERPRALAATEYAPERTPSASDFTAQSIASESSLDAPPAAPEGCALDGPVRRFEVGTQTVAFATAVAGPRTLLALSSATSAATYLIGSDPIAAFERGPMPPSTALFAAGARDALTVAWSTTEEPATHRASLRLALFRAAKPLLVVEALSRHRLSIVDAQCAFDGETRCHYALGSQDEFALSEAEAPRAALLTLRADDPLAHIAPPREHAGAAVSAVAPSLVVRTPSGLSLIDAQSQAHPLEASLLDVAPLSPIAALTASAPTQERCQPQQWNIERQTLSAAAVVLDRTPLATVDARPRGARIRSIHGDPLVLFLDAPGCADRLSYIRSHRRGQSVTLTTAAEYDVATDGALVSLAWRDGERVRWARYRCR